MTAPERIYLQGTADAPDCEDPNSGVTWCWHQIDDTDVEYVRADIAARATAEQSTDGTTERKLTVDLAVTVMRLMRHLPKGDPEFDKAMKLLNENGFIKTYTLSGKS